MLGSSPDRNSDRRSVGWLHALATLLAAVFFVLDIVIPLGVAAGVPYVAVVLLSLRLPRSRDVLFFALGCSVLTLVGIAFSPGPGGAALWKVLANRALALFAIWATAILGAQRHVAKGTLRVARGHLEDERREHATALAERQARLSGIVQSAMDGIITVDEEQKIVVFNHAAEEIFGAKAVDMIGNPLDHFIPERFRENHPGLIRQFAGSGVTRRHIGALGHVCGLRSDGTEFPAEISISQVEIGGEKVFTAVIRDITERKQAEEELAIRAQQQAAIAELGQRALLGRSLQNTMQDCVETLSRALDVEYAEVLELLPDEMALRFLATVGWKPGLVGKATVPSSLDSEAGYTLSVDHPVVVTDLLNETRFSRLPLFRDHGVRSGMSVIVRGDDRPYGVLGVHTQRSREFSDNDIDFVQAVAHFIGLAVRRARAEEDLRITEERAREAEELASISTITAGIAHDVGTPMNIIMGYADMLERGLEDPKACERAAIIKEQVSRVVRLIDTLLNMARPTKGSLIPVELEGVLEASLSFYQEMLKKHGIVVERDFEPVPTVYGNPDRLQQVFLNLFVNTADAMPDGGTLFVCLRSPSNDEVEILVRDTGTGIASEDLKHIFEPFFTTKDRGEGNGLGLLVSKSILVDHGGSIEARSEPGSGTEFRILLPVQGQAGGDPRGRADA